MHAGTSDDLQVWLIALLLGVPLMPLLCIIEARGGCHGGQGQEKGIESIAKLELKVKHFMHTGTSVDRRCHCTVAGRSLYACWD